ncbi:MAG: hypothetical protein IPI49_25790 [Myxococcales bacterium]|nr:hypothetical protein [Myxococcales bacterium]
MATLVLAGGLALAFADSAPRTAAAPAPSTWAPVRAALVRGDLDETARQARAAGRGALLAALRSADRTAAVAALVALAARAEPWPLDELAKLARAPDRRRALAAVATARAVAARLQAGDGAAAEAEDLDGEALREATASWLAIAREPARWSDLRADGLEVAALLAQAAHALGELRARDDLEAALRDLLADPDPALQRAAIELWPAPLSAAVRAELARRVLTARDDAMATVAAAALCAELAPSAPDLEEPDGASRGEPDGASRGASDGAGRNAPVDPGAPALPAPPSPLTALGPGGLARVQALARAVDEPAAADVELARCLRADASAASLGALRWLLASARGPIRHALLSVERGAR